MDRALPKSKWNSKKITTIAGVTAIVLLISGSIYFTSGKSKLNVDTERITISEIGKGKFQEFIPVNGIVMPLSTIYLDATEGGRVEEKYVEDGAMMKKGDPILRLSNTDLELTLSNQETAVFDVLTQMQNTRNNAQQNTVSKLTQLADVDNELKEAERKYQMNKKLFDQRIIGLQEFKASENEYTHQVRKKRLADRILSQDSVSVKQQLKQMNESYERMSNALQLMKKKVGDLIVRAPVDGQLTSMDAEIGQNKNKGERLGQIDVLSGFKVRADIDEHYITRIFPGLTGDFSLADKVYKLRIKKVYTQVTNGRFQVDMEFLGKAPEKVRRGQTLQVRLALGDETTALLLARGGFYQQTGGNWIFKLSSDGKTAYKTDIQLGRQNPDYYEILSGLKPGDKVITSSYENFGDVQELVLKQ